MVGVIIGWIVKEQLMALEYSNIQQQLHPEFLDANAMFSQMRFLLLDLKTILKNMTTKTKQAKLPTNAFQSEILERVSKARSNAKKVEVLKEYRNDALVSILIWNFDDTVLSILPEGTPPYKENDALQEQNTRLSEENLNIFTTL